MVCGVVRCSSSTNRSRNKQQRKRYHPKATTTQENIIYPTAPLPPHLWSQCSCSTTCSSFNQKVIHNRIVQCCRHSDGTLRSILPFYPVAKCRVQNESTHAFCTIMSCMTMLEKLIQADPISESSQEACTYKR